MTKLPLDPPRAALVARITDALLAESSARCIALGGSYARGHATASSDIDLVFYYDADAPPDPQSLTQRMTALGAGLPVHFSAPLEWGPWVNGGAWLNFGEQRVDVLYRSLDRVAEVLDECAAGEWSLHWGQQPPYGYFSPCFVEELAIGVAIVDRSKRFAHLQSRAEVYPARLRDRLVQDLLWNAEFTLSAFAPKYIVANDSYGYGGCASRVAFALVQALFALNLRWPAPDRIALTRLAGLPNVPAGWVERLAQLTAGYGTNSAALQAHANGLRELWDDACAIAGSSYVSKTLPGRAS